MADKTGNKDLNKNESLYEIEIKHLTNDLRLTREEYETSRRKYFEIYNKLIHINEQLQKEIKAKKKTRQALAVRLRYEEGLANFSRVLMKADETSIPTALPHLLRASPVSRVYIFENFNDEKDGLCIRLKNETCAKGIEPQIKNPDLQHIPYNRNLDSWKSQLCEKKSISGLFKDFPKTEQQFLKTRSISSILVLPIFVNDEWYGFIGFDDVKDKRQWGVDDIRMLETASEIMGVFLERKVAEEKLIQARKLAEQANQLKSQFVFNVSHEMRTPLNCIIGFAESILNSQSIDENKKYADTVLQQSDMLLMLISDLLDMAKIEAGKMVIEHRPLDLYKLLERLYSSLKVQALPKGLDLKVDIAQDVFRYLVGDELRLLQVLMNLGSNAVKFTEQGTINIKVQTLSSDEHSATLKFSVIDTGIGIAEENQQEIFKSFTQADGSITRKYGGTGLGTTIASQLVELMGGLCGLESEPDKGSHFWFTIPMEITSKAKISATPVMARKSAPDQVIKKTGNILLAEDYPPNKKITLMHLENAGYTVDTVENGVQAVEACKNKEYDLILMDVQMPEMDGYEATRKIRAGKSGNKSTVILAITAYADSTSLDSCRAAGMNDIIIKPIRRDTFLSSINKWMPGQAAGEKSTSTEKSGGNGKKTAGKNVTMDYNRAVIEFGGNKFALDNVIKQFIDNMENQILIFKTALETKDVETFRSEAHRIRGGAANLTAERLANVAEHMEEMAIKGNLEKAGGYLNEFEKEFAKFKAYIFDLNKN